MSLTYSPLVDLSAGIYTALNVGAVTGIATGGVGDEIGPNPTFPFLLFEVEEKYTGGLGTQPGTAGALYEVTITLHAFAQDGTAASAVKLTQTLINAAIGVLINALSLTGWSNWANFYDESMPAGDQLVAGIQVKELVAKLRAEVELQP